MKTLRILLTISFTLTAASLVAQSRHYNSQTLGMGMEAPPSSTDIMQIF